MAAHQVAQVHYHAVLHDRQDCHIDEAHRNAQKRMHIPASSQAESIEILIISSNLPRASSRSVYEALKQPQFCYLMFAIWHMPILVDVEAAVVGPLPPQICYHKSANVWLLADGALPIVLTTDVLLH